MGNEMEEFLEMVFHDGMHEYSCEAKLCVLEELTRMVHDRVITDAVFSDVLVRVLAAWLEPSHVNVKLRCQIEAMIRNLPPVSH